MEKTAASSKLKCDCFEIRSKQSMRSTQLSFTLFCDLHLIARSGTSHVIVSLTECAPHT